MFLVQVVGGGGDVMMPILGTIITFSGDKIKVGRQRAQGTNTGRCLLKITSITYLPMRDLYSMRFFFPNRN